MTFASTDHADTDVPAATENSSFVPITIEAVPTREPDASASTPAAPPPQPVAPPEELAVAPSASHLDPGLRDTLLPPIPRPSIDFHFSPEEEAQFQADEAETRRQYWLTAFTDPKKLDDFRKSDLVQTAAKAGIDPDELSYRSANQAYLSDQAGIPPEDLGHTYEYERDNYTRQRFGRIGMSDKEVFQSIGQDLKVADGRRHALQDLAGDFVVAAIDDLKNGTHTSMLPVFHDWRQKHADLPDTGDDETAMMHQAISVGLETRNALRQYGPQVKTLLGLIDGYYGANGAAPKTQQDVQAGAANFLGMPPEALRTVLGYAKLYNDRKAPPAPSGAGARSFQVASNLADSVGRSFGEIGRNFTTAANEYLAHSQLETLQRIQSGEAGPEEGIDRLNHLTDSLEFQVNHPENRTYWINEVQGHVTREGRQQQIDKLRRTLEAIQIARQLYAAGDGEIDPIRTVTKGWMRPFEEGSYAAARTAPYVGMALIPEVGGPLVAGAIASSEYNRIRLQYPKVPLRQAQSMALLSAGAQSLVFGLRAASIKGALPITERFLGSISKPNPAATFWKGVFSREAAVNVGEQVAQQAAISLTPTLVDGVAQSLGVDLPGFDWKKALEPLRDGLPTTAASMVPWIILGVAGVGINQTKRGRAVLSDPAALVKATGIDARAAAEIAAEPDLAKKTTLFQAAFRAMTPEQRAAQVAALDLQARALRAQQELPDSPKLIILPKTDGTVDHSIRAASGEEVFRTADEAAASAAYQLQVHHEQSLAAKQKESPEKRVPIVVHVGKVFPNLAAAKAHLHSLVGTPLHNAELDSDFTVSRRSSAKMASDSAMRKSTSAEAHVAAIQNIEELTAVAVPVSHSDRNSDPNIRVLHDFYAPMSFKGQLYRVKIKAKEFENARDPRRLYSIESVQIEKPPGGTAEAALEPTSDAEAARYIGPGGTIKVTDLLPKSSQSEVPGPGNSDHSIRASSGEEVSRTADEAAASADNLGAHHEKQAASPQPSLSFSKQDETPRPPDRPIQRPSIDVLRASALEDGVEPTMEVSIGENGSQQFTIYDSSGREVHRTSSYAESDEALRAQIALERKNLGRETKRPSPNDPSEIEKNANTGRIWTKIAEDPKTASLGETPTETDFPTILRKVAGPSADKIEVHELRRPSGTPLGYEFREVGTDRVIELKFQTPDKVYIDSTKAGIYSTPIYQAIYAWAHNTGHTVIEDPRTLSDIAVLRRTSQMFSSALRYGTTRHLRPGWRSGISGWRIGDDLVATEHNVGLLARREAELVRARLPFVQEMRYSPEEDAFYDGDHKIANAQLDAYLERRIAALDPDFAHGAGPRTVRRALVTAAAEGSGQNGTSRLVGPTAEASALEHIRYSLGDEHAPSSGAQDIDAHVETAKARVFADVAGDHPEVVVHADPDSIPDSDLRQHVADEDAKGRGKVDAFYNPDDGKIHLIASRVSPEQVEAKIRHEALHWALDKNEGFRNDYTALMGHFDRSIPEEARASIESQYGKDPLRVTEEYLAHLAETEPKGSTWRKFVVRAKTMLARWFPGVKFSEDDIREFMRSRMARGRDTSIFGKGPQEEGHQANGGTTTNELEGAPSVHASSTLEPWSTNPQFAKVGQTLREAESTMVEDAATAPLLDVRASNEKLAREAAEIVRGWPKTLQAADGSGIDLHTADQGSLARRVFHLIRDEK